MRALTSTFAVLRLHHTGTRAVLQLMLQLSPVVVAMLLAASVMPARAADTDALRGKTIRVVIGSAAGGVGDTVARLYFKAMADALPETSLRVQNVSGGAGARAIKEVQEAGSGITLGFTSNGPLYSHMLGPDRSTLGRLDVRWVGSFMIGQRVLVARPNLGVRTLSELKSRGAAVKIGAGEAQDPSTIDTYVLNAVLGLGMRVIPGMDNGQLRALLIAGDLDLAISGSSSLADLLRAGSLVPVLKYTDDDEPDFLRVVPSLALPDDDPKARDAIAMIQTLLRLRNLLFAAPNTDRPTLDALRAIFDRVAADRAFLGQVARFDVSSPTSGRALDEALDAANGEVGGRLLAAGDAVRFFYECGVKMSEAGTRSCPR